MQLKKLQPCAGIRSSYHLRGRWHSSSVRVFHNIPFPPPQFASSQRKSLERLNIFQTVRSCRQINVGSGGCLGHFLFCGRNTAESLPDLSSPSPPPLITLRFHFNDFLVSLGGPVIRGSPPQNKASFVLMVLRGSPRGSRPHAYFGNVSTHSATIFVESLLYLPPDPEYNQQSLHRPGTL